MMTAEMTAAQPDGSERAVARLSAWLIARSDTRDAALDRYPPMPRVPDTGFRHHWQGRPGYLETVTWLPQPDDAGASVVWMRPLISLVDDEELTDLQRLAMVVDSANGVGAALDPNEFLFMNTDTTVHLHRTPRGPGILPAGPRLDRSGRSRVDDCRAVRRAGVHRDLGADAVGAAALTTRARTTRHVPEQFTNTPI